jgi:hypothetical protein
MAEGGDDDDNVRQRVITDETINGLMRDMLAKNDRMITERLGRPLVLSLMLWPSRQHELVSYIANIEPERRDEIASAMIELLIRWGYIEK